jgi:cobalt-zinc-cadmium efflux system outer membrane protein
MRTALVLALAAGCYTPPSAAPPTPAELEAWSAGRATSGTAPTSWDMDENAAVSYASTHAPLWTERHDVEAVAAAEVDAAGQLTNPEIHVGKTFDGTVGQSDRIVVALRVSPDNPWERDASIASARADLAAERAHSAITRLDIEVRIRTLYASIAFGEATRDVLAKQLGVLAQRQKVLAEQVARGTATALEAMLADEDVLELETTRSTLDVELVRARAELGQLIGIPHGQAWRPVWNLENLRKVSTSFDRANYSNTAMHERPELAEAAHRMQAADALAYRERVRRAPWIQYVQVERSVRDNVDWAFSFNLSLPIFSLNSGRIAAADARTHIAATERQRIAAETMIEIDSAAALAETTGKRAKELADRIGPLDKALTDLLAANTVQLDPVKLLLLEERHTRAERALLSAQLDHRLAAIKLQALAGGWSWH